MNQPLEVSPSSLRSPAQTEADRRRLEGARMSNKAIVGGDCDRTNELSPLMCLGRHERAYICALSSSSSNTFRQIHQMP